jgi:Skp family chaperone for outer membrane proteins
MKRFLILCLALSFFLPAQTSAAQQPGGGTSPKEEDVASRVEKAAETAEKKIHELSGQLKRVLNVLEEKYKTIAPKIREMKDGVKDFLQKFDKTDQKDRKEQQTTL